jgi:hypothetical protein
MEVPKPCHMVCTIWHIRSDFGLLLLKLRPLLPMRNKLRNV